MIFPGFSWFFLILFEFSRIYWVPESTPVPEINQLSEINQLLAFNQLPESPPIPEIPPIYLIFENFQHLLNFRKIPVFFLFWKFPSFLPFLEIRSFSIFGHSHQFISIFGSSHHFSGVYLLFIGLYIHIWNFWLFFRIFLDPFGIS